MDQETNMDMVTTIGRIIGLTTEDLDRLVTNIVESLNKEGITTLVEQLECIAQGYDKDTLFIGASMYAAFVHSYCPEDGDEQTDETTPT